MSLWRYGWWLDGHQAASTVVASTGPAMAAGKYYWEVTVVSAAADGTGGYGIHSGVANASTVLTGTVAPAINVAQANSTGAAFINWRAANPISDATGWGYPLRPGSIPGGEPLALNAVMAFCLDTINHKIWWRNVTDNKPAGGFWAGDLGTNTNGVPNTNTLGADLVTMGITGDLFVLCGGSHGSAAAKGVGTVNFGYTAFTGTPPAGFVSIEGSYPGAALNPADNSNLILSNGNLTFDATNVPVSFSPPIEGFSTNVGYSSSVRSAFKIAQAP